MAECPNCGATVEEGAPVCDSCGMSLGDDLGGGQGGQDAGQGDGGDAQHGQTEGDHQHGGEPQQGGQPRGEQPRQGAQGGQPQGGQPHQPRQGQPQGGQPRQGQPQGGQPRQGQPQQGQPRQGQPQGQAPPQGGQAPPQGGQPQQGQYGGAQQGYQQQGQYRQPRDDEVVAGLNRRQLLGIGGAGVAVVAVGGFLLLGGSSGPAGTAESFVNALNNGDGQAAADLLHPDSSLTENRVGQLATLFGQVDIGIQGSEVTQQSDGRAIVEIEASAQGQTNTLRMEMRQTSGEWLVYSFQGV